MEIQFSLEKGKVLSAQSLKNLSRYAIVFKVVLYQKYI